MAETYVEYSINRKLCERKMLAFFIEGICLCNKCVYISGIFCALHEPIVILFLEWYLNVIRTVFIEERRDK